MIRDCYKGGHCPIEEPADPPHVATRQTRREVSTWSPTRAQALDAFARYVHGQALDIVRSDA